MSSQTSPNGLPLPLPVPPVFPPRSFRGYGARKENGVMERHPVLDEEYRTVERLQAALLPTGRLVVPDIYTHQKCGKRTLMGRGVAETLLLSKSLQFQPYKALFCAFCMTYVPIGELVWADNGAPLHSYTL